MHSASIPAIDGFTDRSIDCASHPTGPIIAQAVVPVHPERDSADDIAQRVLKEEHKLYPRVVKALCNGDVRWTDAGMPYIWEEAESEDSR